MTPGYGMTREERLALLRARNERVRSPAVKWLLSEVDRLDDRVGALRLAIRDALEDEESRPGGWGPDISMVGVLRRALESDDRAAEGQTK